MKKTQQKQEEKALRTKQYHSSFLTPTEFIARQGRSAYISTDHHEKLSRIVFILGEGKITLSDYLHNVLKQHFKYYEHEINTIYVDKQKPIV